MAKSMSDLRKMPRTQLVRINKEDLIESILAAPDPSEGIVQDMMDKLNELASEVKELRKEVAAPDSYINKRYDELKVQVDKQADILAKQQCYLEVLDRKERENNLIVTGVPDESESLEGGTSDVDKLRKICYKVGVNEEIQSYRRLGVRGDPNKRRAILLTVKSKAVRDNILEKTRQLKDAGGEFKKNLHKEGCSSKHSERMEEALRCREDGEGATRECWMRGALR